MKYLQCTINEQDGTSERDTEMYLELPDAVTFEDEETMFRAFTLDWYSDGEYEDEEYGTVWFASMGLSVSFCVEHIDTKAEWDTLVKYNYNSTAKFLQHLPNAKEYAKEYNGKYGYDA